MTPYLRKKEINESHYDETLVAQLLTRNES